VANFDFEEEEFSTQFNGKTMIRILGLVRPYWKRVVAFLVMITLTSVMDSFFTYLSKLIIDDAIIPGNRATLIKIASVYGSIILFQAVTVFSFIYLSILLGERVRYDLRKVMFNHLQDLSLAY